MYKFQNKLKQVKKKIYVQKIIRFILVLVLNDILVYNKSIVIIKYINIIVKYSYNKLYIK